MKKSLQIVFFINSFLLHTNDVAAQQYISVLDNVNKWAIFTVEIGVGQERSYFSNSGFFNSHDSIIDSIAYKWIEPDNHFYYFPGDSLQYFLREDTAAKQIYIKYNDSIAEYLIYDFNLIAGDSIYLQFKSSNFTDGYFTVDSIGSLTTLAGIRRTWHLANDFNQKIVWIEGIGSIYGPIYTANTFCDFCVFSTCYNQIYTTLFLTCAFKDTVQLYQNSVCDIPPEFLAIPNGSCLYSGAGGIHENSKSPLLEVHPNPNNGITFLKFNENYVQENSYLSVINSQGQIVMQIMVSKSQLQNEIKIDLSLQKSGVYSIYDNYGNSARIIKQ